MTTINEIFAKPIGRDIEGVIKQYNKFVKPAFDQYIQPTMRLADIVVPRGTAPCSSC